MTGKEQDGGAEQAKGSEEAQAAAGEKDDAGKAVRPRRIVRSRSTAVAGEAEPVKAEDDAKPAEAEAPAVEGEAASQQGVEAAAPRESAPQKPRHDLRAPARPMGAGGRPSRPRPEGMPQRPPRPGALPRPRPEGMPQRPPRPGALPHDHGDRPRPPRDAAQSRPGEGRGDDRPSGPRPDRPSGPRGDRPSGPRHERPRHEGGAPRAEARPSAPEQRAAKPAAPAPKPAAPAAPAKPAAPPKPATPAPLAVAPKANKPVVVPLLRAGQAPVTTKPVLTPKEALAQKTKAHAAKAAAPKHDEHASPSGASVSTEIPSGALAAGWDDARSFVTQMGDAAPALVDAWLGATNAAAIAAIADAGDVPGAARKAARRALAVLKSRGVAIPERPKAARADEAREAFEATMIPADASGTWSVAITSRDSSGRYRIAEVIGRDGAGIVQAAGGWLSGSRLKEGRARAQNNVGMAPVAVPLAWARARVAATLALNTRSGQVIPLGYEACRELFEVDVTGDVEHPIADLDAKVTGELVSERAKASATLHNEPEFATWIPDRRSLEEVLQQVGTRLGPAGVQDQEQVNAVMREEMEAATDRYFSPEKRDELAARMRDSAIAVRARKGDDRALDVLATARAAKEAGLITSPPREIPFLLAFFEKGLSALARLGGGQLRVPVQQQAGPAPVQVPAPTPTEAPAEST